MEEKYKLLKYKLSKIIIKREFDKSYIGEIIESIIKEYFLWKVLVY